jgi:hypothetical protein
MVSSRAPEPTDFWWINKDSQNEYDQVGVKLNLAVAKLRANAENIFRLPGNGAYTAEEVVQLKHRAEIIEEDIRMWERNLPLVFHPITVAWDDDVPQPKAAAWSDEIPLVFQSTRTEKPFPGKIDTYSNIWVANFRNSIKTSRLLLWTTIIRCTAWLCSPQDYRITPDYFKAARIGEEIITDILASVPNFLDLDWQKPSDLRDFGHSANSFPVGDANIGNRGLGGLFLLWPLISAASSDYCTAAQREWIKGKMRFIGESMGIGRATLLSQVSWRV